MLWLAAAVVTYSMAARYANRAIDASLSQAARSLARQVKPIGNGLLIDFPRAAQDIIEADPDDRVFYMVSTPPGQFILGNRKLEPPPPALSPALGDAATSTTAAWTNTPAARGGAVPGLRRRRPTSSRPCWCRSHAAAPAASSSRAASCVDTALPLSGLVLLMTLIVWAGIRAGLAPLARLRAAGGRPRTQRPGAAASSTPRRSEVRALAAALNPLLAEVQRAAWQRSAASSATPRTSCARRWPG